MKDLTNIQFGRLRVQGLSHVKRYTGNSPQTKPYWKVVCECGVEKVVSGQNLLGNKINSCGCIAREKSSDRMKRLRKTHGLTNTLAYKSYTCMIRRVLKPDTHHKKYYKNVTICDRWLGESGLQNFIQDMGDRPSLNFSLDRIDNNGHYEPSNCRWSTKTEQMRNTRRSIKYKE